MRISGEGTKFLKVFYLTLISVSIVIALIDMFFIEIEVIPLFWFIIIVFGLSYLFFIRRIQTVYVYFEKNVLVVRKQEIKIKDVVSVKRYWLYFYKIAYRNEFKERQSFIFIISPFDLFGTPDYIRLLKKRIRENKTDESF